MGAGLIAGPFFNYKLIGVFYLGEMAKEKYYEKLKGQRWHKIAISTRHCMLTPKEAGIYVFIEVNYSLKTKRLLYVGMSKNLRNRLRIWHDIELRHDNECSNHESIVICKIMFCKKPSQKEVKYIKRLRPAYNIAHNHE